MYFDRLIYLCKHVNTNDKCGQSDGPSVLWMPIPALEIKLLHIDTVVMNGIQYIVRL